VAAAARQLLQAAAAFMLLLDVRVAALVAQQTAPLAVMVVLVAATVPVVAPRALPALPQSQPNGTPRRVVLAVAVAQLLEPRVRAVTAQMEVAAAEADHRQAARQQPAVKAAMALFQSWSSFNGSICRDHCR
jgi:hypothetical protein